MEEAIGYLPSLEGFSLYLMFSILVFSAQESSNKFNGSSAVAGLWLSLTGLFGICFKYGFLIYYGYTVGWLYGLTLFVVGGLLILLVMVPLLAQIVIVTPLNLLVFGYTE